MKTKYEETLFYQINLSAKCFDMLFNDFFKRLNMGITSSEHLALGVIMDTKDCCQRDLAKIILKDRANTGKLAKSLEEKGLIDIEIKTKNNKPVKILTITKKGKEFHEKAMEYIKPLANKIQSEFSEQIIDETVEILKNFRKLVENTVKVNI